MFKIRKDWVPLYTKKSILILKKKDALKNSIDKRMLKKYIVYFIKYILETNLKRGTKIKRKYFHQKELKKLYENSRRNNKNVSNFSIFII